MAVAEWTSAETLRTKIAATQHLRIDDRPTKLAQAVAELGRIDKTIHALTYIDGEAKRRRTLIQLNRGEERHKLARAVFHGKRGELRQRYREGQEDQLGALGLVVNVIVLWNTLYMNAALEQLQSEGFRSTRRTSHGFPRWCSTTSTCLVGTPSLFRMLCKEESCDPCGARRTLSMMSPEGAYTGFLFRCSPTPMNSPRSA